MNPPVYIYVNHIGLGRLWRNDAEEKNCSILLHIDILYKCITHTPLLWFQINKPSHPGSSIIGTIILLLYMSTHCGSFENREPVDSYSHILQKQDYVIRYQVDNPSNGCQVTFAISLLWTSDAIWRHRSGTTLVQVRGSFLTWPSYYLNNCLIIMKVMWHSHQNNYTASAQTTNLYN